MSSFSINILLITVLLSFVTRFFLSQRTIVYVGLTGIILASLYTPVLGFIVYNNASITNNIGKEILFADAIISFIIPVTFGILGLFIGKLAYQFTPHRFKKINNKRLQ